jgi:FolB domain-containing protein
MFTVKISKLKVRAKIGVFVVERSTAQPLLVTLKFSYRINNNKDVNNINNLKSYSEIINFLKKYIESSRYKTLEKLIISE